MPWTGAPGTNADAGTPVAVVVGKQPSNVSVPDVTGQDADSARSALTKAGFQVQVQGDTSGDAVVTGMNPSAGTKVAKGTTVTITMGSSNSGNQVQMPNLVGMDVASAQAAVQQAGLTNVRRQNVPVNDRSQDGKIQQQTVPAGQQIDKDQQVTVLVGQYSVIPSGGGGN